MISKWPDFLWKWRIVASFTASQAIPLASGWLLLSVVAQASDCASVLPCCKEEAVVGCVGWSCGIGTVLGDCKEGYLNSRALTLQWMVVVCLAALHRSSVAHASIPKVTARLSHLQEVHKERIALETQLEQLRPVTVLWLPAPPCSGKSTARIPTALQGEEHGVAEQGFCRGGGGGEDRLVGSRSPRCARLPLRVKKV